VVRDRADRLVGILNGVDYALWSPEKDKFIAAKYSAKDLSGKQLCKQALMELFDLPTEYSAKPINRHRVAFRRSKRIRLIAERAHELMHEDLLLVVLGTGDRKYEELFRVLPPRIPDVSAFKIAYDNAVAHKLKPAQTCF